MSRCHTCDKPIATPEDFKNIPGGEGEHLCWSEYSKFGCEPIDWRERAVAAESEIQKLKAALKIVCDQAERLERERDYWKRLNGND